jgi:hypothetical protein
MALSSVGRLKVPIAEQFRRCGLNAIALRRGNEKLKGPDGGIRF